MRREKENSPCILHLHFRDDECTSCQLKCPMEKGASVQLLGLSNNRLKLGWRASVYDDRTEALGDGICCKDKGEEVEIFSFVDVIYSSSSSRVD